MLSEKKDKPLITHPLIPWIKKVAPLIDFIELAYSSNCDCEVCRRLRALLPPVNLPEVGKIGRKEGERGEG